MLQLILIFILCCFRGVLGEDFDEEGLHFDPHGAGTAENARWTYKGQDQWKNLYPDCGGWTGAQSPVNIVSNQTLVDFFSPPLVLKGYDQVAEGADYILVNEGHTIQFRLRATRREGISVAGGRLRGRYIADHITFHWGQNDSVGSEHTLNGKAFPMEMQIVHYSSLYSGMDEARDKKDGILIVAVLFKIGPNYNFMFDWLISDGFPEHNARLLFPFPLFSLFPERIRWYWTYRGSLTHPPCTENVQWIIFQNTVRIQSEQIEHLRKMLTHERHANRRTPMHNTFRDVQPLGRRTVHEMVHLGRDRTRSGFGRHHPRVSSPLPVSRRTPMHNTFRGVQPLGRRTVHAAVQAEHVRGHAPGIRRRGPFLPVGTSRPAATPSKPDAASSSPGAAPSSPGAAPSSPGAAPSSPGAAPSSPGAAPSRPGAAPSNSDAAPGSAPVRSGASTPSLPSPRFSISEAFAQLDFFEHTLIFLILLFSLIIMLCFSRG